MLHTIKQIIQAEPYHLRIKFNNAEIREVDLEPMLKEWSKSPESKFKPLLDKEYFKSVKLNPELETIYWDNGIDLCPETLYRISKPV